MNNNSRNNIIIAVLFAMTAFSPALAVYTAVQTPEDKILAKAFAAYMDGSDKRALSYFEEVIRINPSNKAAQKGLEKVKIRLKKMEETEKQKALLLAKARMKEGENLEKTGDVVAAVDSYHAAIDAVPHYKPAVKALASLKKEMARVAERRKLNLTLWSFSRGVMAYLDRDWAKAWRIWSERLAVEPGNVALANATARAENNFKRMMVSEQEDFFRRGARAFYEQGLYGESKLSWSRLMALVPDDMEALEGQARAEEALLRAQGKGRDNAVHDLLEQGLEHYASQEWRQALEAFKKLQDLDPDFSTAKEYIAKLNKQLESPQYTPVSLGGGRGDNWRPNRPSNQGTESVKVPDKLENYSDSKRELQAQLNRDPSNIRIQQELERITKAQDDESERIYKDGLIAYSQGNRSMAIQQWKQVLVINPEHKKAAAALRKARAEEERTADGNAK